MVPTVSLVWINSTMIISEVRIISMHTWVSQVSSQKALTVVCQRRRIFLGDFSIVYID